MTSIELRVTMVLGVSYERQGRLKSKNVRYLIDSLEAEGA
jgi:hypothetical protein